MSSTDEQSATSDERAEMQVSEQIVRAVAAERDVDPAALDPPLFDVVDPEALNDLVDGDTPSLVVEFTYADCRVTIQGDEVAATDLSQGR